MVKVTRTGLRMASSAADAAADIAGDTAPEENGVINPSRIGLVTGQAVEAALAHHKFKAHQRRREAGCSGFAAKAVGTSAQRSPGVFRNCSVASESLAFFSGKAEFRSTV
jgi:hypothetical protein